MSGGMKVTCPTHAPPTTSEQPYCLLFLTDLMSPSSGRTQGGSNADNVLADAYVKGVRGAVDWSAGYQALLKDATVTPNNTVPPDPMAPDSSTKEGRGALPDWIEYRYITPTFSRAVSRAVDYSVNDFGVSQVAAGLGHTKDAALFLNRSRNWRNHWNPAATSLGFSGFVVPRRANGSFIAQDPLSCGGCYWGDAYYEALPWEYSFGVYHDVATLIEYCNGTDTFVARLDKFFESGVYSGNSAFGNTLFNLGNEPSFATPYLYNFAGRQDRSVEVSRYFIRSFYQPTVGGLPGNSDAGAMQAYLLWSLIGMYPLTGTTTFLVASPWLADLRIDLGGGKSLSITTEGAAADSFYVQGLEVNGCPWDKNWVSWHDVFAKGGTMHFVLGPNAKNDWASGELPPSPAS